MLESIVVDQWKLIFAEVDDDDNQVLDLEEFVEAIARIDQIPKFPEGQVRALFLDSLQDQETQFIDEGQFVEIVNRLAETSLPPPEESSFGETARPSTPSLTALDSFAITKNSIADIQQDIRDKDMVRASWCVSCLPFVAPTLTFGAWKSRSSQNSKRPGKTLNSKSKIKQIHPIRIRCVASNVEQQRPRPSLTLL